jgi:translation initiation factor IF-2
MASRKLFKLAKEFNLGTDTLINFLTKMVEEGKIELQFKGPMTAVNDEVYEILLDKFQREKQQADKLHKRKERVDETDEETEQTQEILDEIVEPKTEEKVVESDAEEVISPEEEKEEELPEPVREKVEETETATVPKHKTVDSKHNPIEKKKVDGKLPPKKEEIKKRMTVDEEKNDRINKKRKALDLLKKQSKSVGASDLKRIIQDEQEGSFRKKKKKKAKGTEVDKAVVAATVKQTLANQTIKKKKKKIKKKIDDGTEIEINVIKITEFMSTQDLANIMEVPIADIIKTCMLDLQLMVSINQRLDLDTIKLLAESYGYEIEEDEEYGSEYLEEANEESDSYVETKRYPVVTVMGHVDHGKTSLLDYIRSENVVAGESGGITQHIGAYSVTTHSGDRITFLDTPGHEAFTAMRARGAQATDIVIIIVSAEDGMMPQTREAIDHARAASVPMVVAISKIDKPNANPDKVLQQLADYDILVEEWGGKYGCAKVSSKTGDGINELLERLQLEAELLELKAAPERKARGIVIEAQQEKGKGAVATILVQDGTLRIGSNFVVGQYNGRVKAMFDERDHIVEIAGPATAVQVVGIEGIPQAGDRLIEMGSIAQAKEIAIKRQQLKREQDFRTVRKVTLEDISNNISIGGVQDLNIIIKGDVDGSVEAIADSLIKLSHAEVKINVIRKAVGPITESDVILASASGAVIVGFHVRPQPKANILAEHEKVEIRIYKIVYDAIEDITNALEGMLRPEIKENIIGEVEIREVFKISKIGNIAGCYVRKGIIKRDSFIRVVRDGIELHEGKLSSLKRFQDDVKEVKESYECGITVDNFNDIRKDDVLEVYETVEIARKLEKRKES